VSAVHRIQARPPRDPVERPPVLEEPDEVATYLSDASRYPGGSAPRVYLPRHEGHLAWIVRNEPRVLVVGAQSSLTGGATPRGDAVVSTARMDGLEIEDTRARAQPGLSLMVLVEELTARGLYYPPVPTYTGALVGGTVSTNAAGAATWKYGSTRDWVESLSVVLATGEVLDLRRGEVVAHPEGWFEVVSAAGEVTRVPLPGYTMPDVPKRSAGYHSAPGMDLLDLFVGSEGTLGLFSSIELRLMPDPPQVLVCLVTTPTEAAGLELVGELRRLSRETWAAGDPDGLDVRAVESMDRRSLELLREDGVDTHEAVDLPADAEMALVIQVELPRGADASAMLEAFAEGEVRGGAGRLLTLLAERDLLDDADVAMPGDYGRREQLFAIREGVPLAVNHRIERAQREVDPRIHKVAGDMIVPFERFAEVSAVYRRELADRGLDLVVWGHVSDGNVHPNVIPRSHADVEAGHEGLAACGREVVRMGGCPLSEHGTGRNPVKQALLRELYGEDGIQGMRATKTALDPACKLAPGVLFP
jgi:D-lactate dehydrogenase (cytochrome)